MVDMTRDNRRTEALGAWQALADDKDSLLKNPAERWRYLVDWANTAHASGEINASDLSDCLELADAAYEWAVEHSGNCPE